MCVCVCKGKGRADTSLSVVLMVPLTTRQLLHIGVVLAVGSKHKDSHTQAFAHAHTLIIGCQDKKEPVGLSAFFFPPQLSFLYSVSVMAEFTYGSGRPTHNTHPAVHTDVFYVFVSMCHVSPPSLACLLNCQRLAPAA